MFEIAIAPFAFAQGTLAWRSLLNEAEGNLKPHKAGSIVNLII